MIRTAFLLLSIWVGAALAQTIPGQITGQIGSFGTQSQIGGIIAPACAQAASYLAAVTLDAAHQAAITTRICTSVTNGVFAKRDFWYMFATANATAALTNIVNPGTFNGVVHGAPTFTADQGYAGVDASSTVYIDTTFNPTTAPSPKFTQNSAHLSVWSNTNAISSASGGVVVGADNTGFTTPGSHIIARLSDGNAYFRTNDGVFSAGIANANSTGHYAANRSGASAQQGYKNAVSQGVVSQTSAAPPNAPISVLANMNAGGAVSFGSALQLATADGGGNLTATDIANECHADNVYLNTINGTALGTC